MTRVRLALAPPQVGWPNRADPDVVALRDEGWRPTPFRLFLFKVHSRCNLDCDYCYVYHHADQSWRTQPKRMTLATLRQACARVREHAERHGFKSIHVGLHGGEPLLLGAEGLRRFMRTLRQELPALQVDVALQTNGTLLTEAVAQVCVDERVRLGVSVDGTRDAHDAHRRDHRDRGTWDATVRGIELLRVPRFRAALAPVLCTIAIDTDPLENYRALCGLEVPGIDFLLPHGHWGAPPPGKQPPFTDTPYADWLLPIFDAWYDERPRRLAIRFFEEILHLVLGGRALLESLGLAPVNLVVIETDGTIEGVDTLKTAFHGAPATHRNVFDDSFDDVLTEPSIVARQIGEQALSDECRRCDLKRICGGGYYPHRFRPGEGFRNRSIYCADLEKLIRHVQNRVRADLARLREGQDHAQRC